MEAKGWHDERLKALVLQTMAHYALGETDMALHVLDDVLALAAPGGMLRTFIDEGLPMRQLLSEAAGHGVMPGYVTQLLAAFEPEMQPDAQALVEPLSERELGVLHLIADGFSNREIGEQLFLALDTVKGHNRRIYGKLEDVQRRTEAVARARELGLL